MIKNISFIYAFLLLFLTSCEDTDNEANVVVDRFDITKIDDGNSFLWDYQSTELEMNPETEYNIAVNEVTKFESKLLEEFRAKHSEILEIIQNEKELSGDTEQKLKTALDEFSKNFE